MSNKKVLECLEQNVEGLERIQNLMRFEDHLIYSDLMLEINLDHFSGYEACLLYTSEQGYDGGRQTLHGIP